MGRAGEVSSIFARAIAAASCATGDDGRTSLNCAGGLLVAIICAIVVSGCSDSSADRAYVSRPVRNAHVLLIPELRGGWAGWSLATGYQNVREGSAGGGPLTRTLTGPVFAESGCSEDEKKIQLYAVTRSEVVAVSVYRGRPIATTTNATLPDGFRAAAIEVLRHSGQPGVGLHCPRMTPIGKNGRRIDKKGKPGKPQAFRLPGTRRWDAPARAPKGACELTATQLPRETVASEGAVATQIRAYRGLLDQALLSCVDTVYIFHEEHHLTAAVLLSASHPGATSPPLPAMKPLAGYPGIFESPGSEGDLVARRVSGAWLVVEEEDGIGPEVPVELLDDLRVTISRH